MFSMSVSPGNSVNDMSRWLLNLFLGKLNFFANYSLYFERTVFCFLIIPSIPNITTVENVLVNGRDAQNISSHGWE